MRHVSIIIHSTTVVGACKMWRQVFNSLKHSDLKFSEKFSYWSLYYTATMIQTFVWTKVATTASIPSLDLTFGPQSGCLLGSYLEDRLWDIGPREFWWPHLHVPDTNCQTAPINQGVFFFVVTSSDFCSHGNIVFLAWWYHINSWTQLLPCVAVEADIVSSLSASAKHNCEFMAKWFNLYPCNVYRSV